MLPLLSCEKIDLGREITVELNREYRIDRGLSFTIDSISDYRCPSDLICIWAGDADLYFTFDNNDNFSDILNLNNGDTNPYNIAGYTIEILDILPYPVSDVIIDPADVIVKLRVEKE